MCTLLWFCESAACGQMFSLNRFLCSMRGFELITVTGERILSCSGPIFEYFQQLLYIAFYCPGMKNQCELQRRSLLHANWRPFRGQLNPNDLSSKPTKSFHTFTDKNNFKYCANMVAKYSTQWKKNININIKSKWCIAAGCQVYPQSSLIPTFSCQKKISSLTRATHTRSDRQQK